LTEEEIEKNGLRRKVEGGRDRQEGSKDESRRRASGGKEEGGRWTGIRKMGKIGLVRRKD
jgi:hypothetical protein